MCPAKGAFPRLGAADFGVPLQWVAALGSVAPGSDPFAPELINPDSAGNSLSSPRMALDVSKRTLPSCICRTPVVGGDVLVYWEHWELLAEWPVNLGTWYLCKWKFRTVRNSLVFIGIAFKSASGDASPVPVQPHHHERDAGWQRGHQQ